MEYFSILLLFVSKKNGQCGFTLRTAAHGKIVWEKWVSFTLNQDFQYFDRIKVPFNGDFKKVYLLLQLDPVSLL